MGEERSSPRGVHPQNMNVNVKDMLPCGKYHGFFSRCSLFRHRCHAHGKTASGGRVQSQGRSLLPCHRDAAAGLENLMAKMRDDSISSTCRQDALMMEFGARLYTRLGHERYQQAHIREQMRQLGRLLLELNAPSPGSALEMFIHPAKFMEVAGAVKNLAGVKEGKYHNPSLALRLGYALSECAGVLKTRGITYEDATLRTAADDFLLLYQRDWKLHVSSRALTTLQERKWNKPVDLPLNADVQSVTKEVQDELVQAQRLLEEERSIKNYVKLSGAALASIILFNRRRPGEASRLTVRSYTERDQTLNEDVLQHLSPLERELCHSLGHVVVRGKKGGDVPIMLTATMRGALDQLIAARKDVGIPLDCPHIFVNSTAPDASTLIGSDCVRTFARRARVNNITATKYRKHVATMLQVLQLSETEMDIVAALWAMTYGSTGSSIDFPKRRCMLPK
ncbi:uncharacterized protein LOC119102382 [Pollicipes pollicipes]|uniref:uncharacterized protein LOC119102382 n=1 Tax=Pollicipes pollicipes TaxID=41117 RepID=UPI0018850DC7|nr:uncharacterized protein LOC119102357 isoform X1 [Pollicipes pollicipes]XP_037081631.1 uncharacterized protein LOC119102357 isoform X1 [Pollicipes pollicipes]XP_037081650.1 uncharacterized protein LOC119102382 [Pollicipes pollicipes]